MMKLGDFVAESHPQQWLVKGLVPRGHAVLACGQPGVGKSWIVDGMAISVAGNKRYLDLPVMSGPVILVDEDTPSDELGNRFQRLVSGFGLSLADIPLQIHSMENTNLADEATIQRLECEVAQTKSVLIIFDCLSKVMGGDFNENNATDANIAGTLWNRLKATGVTVFVTHHLNKREGSIATDFVKLARGSAALVANSDTAFGIEFGRRNPTRFNVYPQERRRKLSMREPFGIELGEDNGLTWARLKLTNITEEVSDLAKHIWPLFYDDRVTLTVNGVKEKLKGLGSDVEIREALHELHSRGLLQLGVGAHNRYQYSLNRKFLI
ncbi:AAA family ATPase [Chloroflexota bacterium]